jgi:hypothetical protein
VDVGAQSRVVGEIPAFVVGVIVDHDIVAIPIPVIAIGQVKRGDAEVETAKPESAGIAAFDAPPVSTAEATVEAAMFPRMLKVEACVFAPGIVPDPFAVAVDVRSFGMILTVAIGAPVPAIVPVIVLVLVRVAMIGRGAVARNVSATNVALMFVFVSLRQRWEGEEQDRSKKSEEYFQEGTSVLNVTTGDL